MTYMDDCIITQKINTILAQIMVDRLHELKKRIRPNIEACGTPHLIACILGVVLPMQTT